VKRFGFLVLLSLVIDPAPCAARSAWIELPGSPIAPGRHEDVFFLDPNVGWVVNLEGLIYKTTDGGASWAQGWDAEEGLRCVGFADADRGWAGVLFGLTNLLYQTTDGGASWSPITNIPGPRPAGICGISVVNASVVYACGPYWTPIGEFTCGVLRTTDGGATWTARDLRAQAAGLVDCYFPSPDRGFVTGDALPPTGERVTVVLHTSDGGGSWETLYSGTRPAERGWKIAFPSPRVGYIALESSGSIAGLLKTTDGGATWTEMPFLAAPYHQQAIGFVTEDVGWIGGWEATTYETRDGGRTWSDARFGRNVNRIRVLGPGLAYAVGLRVYKYAPIPPTLARESAEKALEMSAQAGVPLSPRVLLGPNVPNPFREATSIFFTLFSPGNVRLAVWNLAGERIAVLADGARAPGEHRVVWDAKDAVGRVVPSGIYVCRLESGEFRTSCRLAVVR